MSGGTAAAYLAGAALAYTVYNGEETRRQQNNAQDQAKQNALKQEKAADEATNRANQKKPDTMSIMDAATQAGKAGVSSTMLTGPQGIDMSALQLGKNTLLGS